MRTSNKKRCTHVRAFVWMYNVTPLILVFFSSTFFDKECPYSSHFFAYMIISWYGEVLRGWKWVLIWSLLNHENSKTFRSLFLPLCSHALMPRFKLFTSFRHVESQGCALLAVTQCFHSRHLHFAKFSNSFDTSIRTCFQSPSLSSCPHFATLSLFPLSSHFGANTPKLPRT